MMNPETQSPGDSDCAVFNHEGQSLTSFQEEKLHTAVLSVQGSKLSLQSLS